MKCINLLLLPILLAINSCHSSDKFELFYTALDDIIRINYFDSSTVIMLNLDTIQVYTPKVEKKLLSRIL